MIDEDLIDFDIDTFAAGNSVLVFCKLINFKSIKIVMVIVVEIFYFVDYMLRTFDRRESFIVFDFTKHTCDNVWPAIKVVSYRQAIWMIYQWLFGSFSFFT